MRALLAPREPSEQWYRIAMAASWLKNAPSLCY